MDCKSNHVGPVTQCLTACAGQRQRLRTRLLASREDRRPPRYTIECDAHLPRNTSSIARRPTAGSVLPSWCGEWKQPLLLLGGWLSRRRHQWERPGGLRILVHCEYAGL